MKDLVKIKAVLVRRVPEEETVMLYEQKKFDRPKEFQDFCQKLKDDPDFKSLYVSKLYKKNFFVMCRSESGDIVFALSVRRSCT